MDRWQDDVAALEHRVARLPGECLVPFRVHAGPEHHERRVAEADDGFGGHLETTLATELAEEQDDPAFVGQTGRFPDQVWPGRWRRPAWLAVEEDRRALAERPEPVAMVGEGVVDRHDGIGTPDPAGLPAPVPRQDPSGHVLVVVRVEDGVDHVIHDEAPPTGVASGARQVKRRRERQDAKGVVEVGGRELAAERSPPGADMERPERDLDRLVGVEGEHLEELRRRLRRRRLADPPLERTARNVPAGRDLAVALVGGQVAARHRGDLDVPPGLGEAPRHAQAPGIGRGRVGDQENGPWATPSFGHQGRPVSRVYSSRSACTWDSQL